MSKESDAYWSEYVSMESAATALSDTADQAAAVGDTLRARSLRDMAQAKLQQSRDAHAAYAAARRAGAGI